ncbi:MAG: class I SAM-dependent methyltransferase, partial [bacterium]|nr:class I SAM-dependent methyltransferase [bacterium]
MAQWFEDESFWEVLYSFLFPAERFSAAEEEVQKIISLVDFKGSKVLDLCCGPGRHALPLAKEGFRVTAVDLIPFLLEKAKAAARSEKVNVEWIHDDMRKFSRPGEYDLIINLFTSFGYFEDEKENAAVLALMHQNLKEGGMLVMDMMGKEILARVYHPTIATELPDGSIVVQRHKICDGWDRVTNDWIVIKDGQSVNYTFTHTIYSG